MSRTIRPATNDDGPAILALIATIYDEHGMRLDAEGDGLELLRAVAAVFGLCGGEFWVAVRGDRVVGTVGHLPMGEGVELLRLYVARDERRAGLGGELCALVEDAARRRGAAWINLWCDGRLRAAGRLYERRGFVLTDDARTLARDGAIEHRFRKSLSG